MLGHTYRFNAKNETGQTLAASTITVTGRRWKLDAGAPVFEVSEGSVLSAGSMATGAYGEGATQDNSTNKYLGGDFLLTATAPASANGNIVIFMEQSTDGGTTWPDNGQGQVVAVLNFTAEGTKKKSFRL